MKNVCISIFWPTNIEDSRSLRMNSNNNARADVQDIERHISVQTEEDKPTKSNKRNHSTLTNIKTHKQVGPFQTSQLTPIEEVPE